MRMRSGPARRRAMSSRVTARRPSSSDFFNKPEERSPRAKDFLAKILQH